MAKKQNINQEAPQKLIVEVEDFIKKYEKVENTIYENCKKQGAISSDVPERLRIAIEITIIRDLLTVGSGIEDAFERLKFALYINHTAELVDQVLSNVFEALFRICHDFSALSRIIHPLENIQVKAAEDLFGYRDFADTIVVKSFSELDLNDLEHIIDSSTRNKRLQSAVILAKAIDDLGLRKLAAELSETPPRKDAPKVDPITLTDFLKKHCGQTNETRIKNFKDKLLKAAKPGNNGKPAKITLPEPLNKDPRNKGQAYFYPESELLKRWSDYRRKTTLPPIGDEKSTAK